MHHYINACNEVLHVMHPSMNEMLQHHRNSVFSLIDKVPMSHCTKLDKIIVPSYHQYVGRPNNKPASNRQIN